MNVPAGWNLVPDELDEAMVRGSLAVSGVPISERELRKLWGALLLCRPIATPVPAASAETDLPAGMPVLGLRFGLGKIHVQTGTYGADKEPCVFLGHDENTPLAKLIFPTATHATRVAEAMVPSTPIPAQAATTAHFVDANKKVAGQAASGGLAWTDEDMKKPWGAEAASLRHLANDPALNADQAMMLRHCAKRIEVTAAAPVASGGFIVANGQGTAWRKWGDFGPEWTTDREAALRFARQSDAESFARDDEDAWGIQPVTAPVGRVEGEPVAWEVVTSLDSRNPYVTQNQRVADVCRSLGDTVRPLIYGPSQPEGKEGGS